MVIRVRRAWCWLFGHDWMSWSGWTVEGVGFRHDRTCTRCLAMEAQRDGEQPVLHA